MAQATMAELWDFLEDKRSCTREQMADFTTPYREKHPKSIKLPTDRAGVVDAIRKATSEGLIPLQDVYAFAREVEENGNQHIFFFVPKTDVDTAALNEWKSVARKLWDGEWKTVIDGFPLRFSSPVKPIWADFRGTDGPPKGLRWTAKAYGREIAETLGAKTQMPSGQMMRPVNVELVRAVFVVRWHGSKLLEIRVPDWAQQTTVDEMLQKTWDMLDPLIKLDEFEPWDLADTRRRLLVEQDKNVEIYFPGDTRVEDDAGGKSSFSPKKAAESLFASAYRKETLERWQKLDKPCNTLAVTWLPRANNDALSSSLRTIIGTRDRASHEVIIGAHTSAKAIDYVVHQLQHFAG